MIRLCGSVKFFWALASGSLEGGAAGRPGLRRPSAARFSAASASALSLASAAAFASASSSALALRILSARSFLSATQAGISSPVLSRPYSLSSCRVRRLGRVEPLGDLGFQFRGAVLHALVAHRLVLRRVGFDLGAVERHMPELHQAGRLAQMQDLPEQSAKRLQVTLAEIRNSAEIRRIEPDDAHEVDTLAASLADTARGVDAAAVGIREAAPSSSSDRTAAGPARCRRCQ